MVGNCPLRYVKPPAAALGENATLRGHDSAKRVQDFTLQTFELNYYISIHLTFYFGGDFVLVHWWSAHARLCVCDVDSPNKILKSYLKEIKSKELYDDLNTSRSSEAVLYSLVILC